MTEAALAAGEKVFATARNPEQLAELASQNLKTFALDVTDEEAANQAVETCIKHFGSLDIVVNNAGYGNICPIEDTSLSEFRAQIETNLFGTIIVTKAALAYFRKRRSGHFIQFSSVGGRIGPIGRGPYAAAKFGVEGFSETLAKEVSPFGVKVTIIEPGGFRTDFAGKSTQLSAGNPEYDQTVGKTARFQSEYDGKQPGDPRKAAQVVLKIANEARPPLRLVLGTDAFNAAEKNDQNRLKEAQDWKHLSVSTDF
jgi:NAD(P)-dependent dehydrogenase (short-subunit alcohol dehydrogenase family)